MSANAYDILAPFITDRVRDLLRQRLFEGLKFYEAGVLRPEFERGEVKLVLLLARLANPKEDMNESEIALVEGPIRQQRQQKVKPSCADLKPVKAQVKPRKQKGGKP